MAQEKTKEILSDAISKADVKKDGWDSFLGLGLNGSLMQNKNVLGKDEGQSTTLGLKVDSELNFKDETSRFLNSFGLMTSFTRTPLLSEYLKSEDKIKLDSLYKHLFSADGLLGAFARGQIESSLFAGYDNRLDPVTYQITKLNGELETETTDKLHLTDPLKPLKLSESLGVFANIWDSPWLTADFKAGLGLRQVYVRGQLALNDDKDTADRVEVKELDNYSKAGYEFGAEAGGKSEDKRLSYKVSANALFPFSESPRTDHSQSTFDKRIVDVSGKVSALLSSWASLDYVVTALRDPNLSAKAQVSQSVMLSSNFVLADRAAP
jgi:hypothetical protein